MRKVMKMIKMGMLFGAAAFLLLLVVYALVLRPWIFRMGATDQEVANRMPGDELIAEVDSGYTQAITVDAPAEYIYPYIIQMGMKRGGWYNLDAINRKADKNYFFENNASADWVIPQLQQLKVGDTISIAPMLDFHVTELEKNDHMLLAATRQGKVMTTWNYTVKQIDPQRTRLIVRWRAVNEGGVLMKLINYFIIDPGGSGLQQRLNLKGIKKRAERDWNKQRYHLSDSK